LVAVAAFLLSAAHSGSTNASLSSSTKTLPKAGAPSRDRVRANFAALPLAFEENKGQTDPQVKYMARANGYTLFLTEKDAVFSFASKPPSDAARRGVPQGKVSRESNSATPRAAAVHMNLVGAKSASQIAASDLLAGTTNYYFGNNPKKWQTGVLHYGRVGYKDVYPGVDLAYYGEQNRLEFDFIVAPQSDAASINLAFKGAQKITTDASGNLVISSAAGNAVLHKPVAYQQQNGSRQSVDARFILQTNNNVSFELGNYDHSRELIIDPSISYATYLGGSAEDDAYGIAVDASGDTYITGGTLSPNFPGPLAAGANFAAFVVKLDPNGAFLHSTFIGGNTGGGNNYGLGIAVNSTGTYVVGNTLSDTTTFPATLSIGPGGAQDAFVAKLDNTTLVASEIVRIGGSGIDAATAIAVDSTGGVYFGGQTNSTDFPLAGPHIQTTNGGAQDAFIAKLDMTGTVLDYSTYLGGSADDGVTGIALDGMNQAYVTGVTISSNFPTTAGAYQTSESGTADNGFVTAVKADGSALIYSTYFGTSGTDALAIAVDSAGEAYITGDTSSTTFPTLNPVQATLKGATDVFISKLTTDGSALLFSTYLGGTLDDTANGIALDSFNDVYVTGRTFSSDYPTSGTPFQSMLSGPSDAFISELSNTGFSVYSSYLGGTGSENSVGATGAAALGSVAVDSTSNAYLAGSTNSTTGFPVTAGTLQGSYGGGVSDGFVAKVGAAPADFSVAVSPTTISTPSGQTTGTVTVTVSSVNAAFGSAVALSCTGVPTHAGCVFSANSVTPGGTPQTSNLTITTNGSALHGMSASPFDGASIFFAALLPFGGILLFGGARRKQLFMLSCIALTLFPLLLLPACGGGSSGGGGGGGGGGGTNTAPGTYSLMVSASAGGVTHTAPLTLTVQ
jgi:hypothetical protein